jgi:hypothetical protein
MVQAPKEYVKQGREFFYQSVQGPNKRLDYLYVKWRDIPTGKVYEKTVNLRQLLSSDINDDVIYPMIYGGDLYVYLALRKPLPQGERSIGASLYGEKINIQIYPKLN